MKETEHNVIVLNTDGFKFARGFKMPDDQNLEDKTLQIIKWGKDNLHPNFLNKLFYSSAYQGGIIRGKVHYITGSGWKPKQGSEEQIDEVFGSYNTQDFIEMIAKDYELYNGFAVRVLRSLEGQQTYEHIDFDMLRADINGGGWWYSDDWSKGVQSMEQTGLKLLTNYDPRTPEFESVYVYVEKPKNKQIKKSKLDSFNVYPEPVYAGCLKSLMTDVEIQSFHLYNIINGMKVAGVLNFANGEPANKREFEMNVQDALTPTENSGGVLINYSNGDDRKPSWIPLNNEDLDKRYLTLETSVVQNIMTGHSITSPMLFGIKTQGQLGGSTELEEAFKIFNRTYVRARQTTIESHVNYLLQDMEIELNEPKLQTQEQNVASTEGEKTIQETALNGAQISSLLAVIENYNNNVIDRDSAIAIITSAFPSIPIEKAQGMVPQTRGAASDLAFAKESEDRILLALLKTGRSKSNFKSLAKNYVDSETFDFENTEVTLKQSFLQFAITDLESKVLDLVRKGEKLDGIVKVLDEDAAAVKKAYQVLTKNNLINKGEITTEGVKELAQNQPSVELEVVYSYGLRPDKQGEPEILPDGRTREFCEVLIESNKVFTRQEIDFISSQEDRNVWLYRGGWYSDPDKPRPTPFCRHIWVQELVIQNN
jgi:hypothetical protein